MPHQIAEQIRTLAVMSARLARECHDQNLAHELEGMAIELTDIANRLDALFDETPGA